LRLRLTRQQYRQRCGADRQRDHREQHERLPAEAQQLLRQRQRTQVHHHVGRKYGPALRRRRLRVEPAFDDRVQADQHHAGQQPQRQPYHRIVAQRVQQHHASRARGAKRERANVADAAHQRRHRERADEVTGVVRRREAAQQRPGIACGHAAQRDQRVEQPGADQQERGAGEQRSDGSQCAQHGYACSGKCGQAWRVQRGCNVTACAYRNDRL
jgi:hypothetical protein